MHANNWENFEKFGSHTGSGLYKHTDKAHTTFSTTLYSSFDIKLPQTIHHH